MSAAEPPSPAPVPQRTAIRRIVTVAFYAAVLALLVWFLLRIDLHALARIRLSAGYLVAGLAVGLAQRMLLPFVWVLIVRDLGVVVRNYSAYNFVYAKAWLGRYLPGKIAMVAARVYFADELGADRSAVVVSSVAEIGAQLLVGLAVGLLGVASLSSSVGAIEAYRPFAFVLMAVLASFLLPPVFNAVMRLLFRIIKRPIDENARVGARTLAWAVGGLLVVSLANGAVAVLFMAAVDTVALDHALFVWGAYSLSIALGMAAVFAPSGLGAREAVQVPLFTLILSPEAAIAVVLITRVGEVAIDALFYVTAAFWARVAKR